MYYGTIWLIRLVAITILNLTKCIEDSQGTLDFLLKKNSNHH